jgi:hypothetical protein
MEGAVETNHGRGPAFSDMKKSRKRWDFIFGHEVFLIV